MNKTITEELNALNLRLEEKVVERTAELAEEALRASEKTFRELVDILPAAVYVCDSSGLIESYNKEAVKLWGRAPKHRDGADRFCGSHKMYKADGTDLPHEACPMAEVLRTGIAASNQEIVIERLDGSRRTAMVNIIPRRDAQGNMTGAINCLTDLTEHMLAAEAVRKSEQRYRLSWRRHPASGLDGETKWQVGLRQWAHA